MALVFARGKTSLPKQLARMTLSRMSKFWRPFFSKTFSIQASACPQELAAAVDPQASNFVVFQCICDVIYVWSACQMKFVQGARPGTRWKFSRRLLHGENGRYSNTCYCSGNIGGHACIQATSRTSQGSKCALLLCLLLWYCFITGHFGQLCGPWWFFKGTSQTFECISKSMFVCNCQLHCFFGVCFEFQLFTHSTMCLICDMVLLLEAASEPSSGHKVVLASNWWRAI